MRGAGDLDGDGDADLVFGNNMEQNRLYLTDGSGMFTDATVGPHSGPLDELGRGQGPALIPSYG